MKLLLVVALRTGHVHATTLHDLLHHTANQADRRVVVWKNSTDPILSQFCNGGRILVPDKLAGFLRLQHNLTAMARVAGVAGRVSTQALRRGSSGNISGPGTTIRILLAFRRFLRTKVSTEVGMSAQNRDAASSAKNLPFYI